MTVWRRMTALKFSEWLATYPRELRECINYLGEPPMMTWNDYWRGPWPACEVAHHEEGSGAFYVLDDLPPNPGDVSIAPDGRQTHNYRR